MIEKLQELGLFGSGRISVLDIGSSNLYAASADGIRRFLGTHGVVPTPAVAEFAERLARGSAYDPVHGGANGAFAGELFEMAGMKYTAVDIANGYQTTILDLNHLPAPPHFVGAFDLVLNFGTTEHLLNQYNAFKVMHDSAKVGGCIVHSLPGVGYSNHGYFTYTPRCFFDLAGYNEYELVAFWFSGPTGRNDLFAPVRDYLSYFPNLARTLADREHTETGRKIAALDIPDVGIDVVYRKVKARPFMGALEKSTSVGNIPAAVTSSYASDQDAGAARATGGRTQYRAQDNAPGPARRLRAIASKFFLGDSASRFSGARALLRHDEIVLTGEARKLREKFVAEKLGVNECMRFYELVVESNGCFPYDWEEHILILGLAREPGRADLSERLKVVRNYLASGAGPNR
jgi:hypothetical protein